MGIKVNNIEINSFNFPGGECSVNISNIVVDQEVDVTAYIYNSDDLIKLLLTINAIRIKNQAVRILLNIPYFPYARQDRVCNSGESFSLFVVAELINNLRCDKVCICDPHSEITPELLNNCLIFSQEQILKGSIVEKLILDKKLTIIAPDKGSISKIEEYCRSLKEQGFLIECLYCDKVRDTKSGKIVQTNVPNEVNGRNIIILDDICDGGKTFVEIAKELKSKGAKKLYLYVTHGIFSKGLTPLKENFSHIFCFHTFLDTKQIDANFLTLIGRSK